MIVRLLTGDARQERVGSRMQRFLGIFSGYQKSGKTGGTIVPLLKAGFRVLHADFDQNSNVVRNFTTPEEQERYVNLPFADTASFDVGTNSFSAADVRTAPEPRAFRNFLVFLQKGRFTYPDKTSIDLGPSGTWSGNTVVVLDSTTAAGLACIRRFLFATGRTVYNMRPKDWYLAGLELGELFTMIKMPSQRFHFIALSHLQDISPEMPEEPDGKADAAKQARIDMRNEIRKQNLDAGAQTRIYPTGIGKSFCKMMTTRFEVSVLVEVSANGKRVFRTTPQAMIDIGVPGKIADNLDVEAGGFMKIFKAVTGVDRPEDEPTDPAE